MKPEEINRAIAEWCGWTHLERSGILLPDPPWRGYPHHDAIVGQKQQIPNYYSNLNACAEFEKALTTMHQRVDYLNTLEGICFSGDQNPDTWFDQVTASPPQRCEALLRTLGLWREE